MRCTKLILSTPSNGDGSSKNSQDEPSALYKKVVDYLVGYRPEAHVYCIALSERGYVARAEEHYIYINKLKTEEQTAVSELENVQDLHIQSEHYLCPVDRMAFNSDSTRIVSVDWRNKICLWNVETGDILTTRKLESRVHCIAFSPDNQYIASAHRIGDMSILDAETLKTIGSIKGVKVRCFAFDPDSSRIATAEQGTLSIRDLQTQNEIFSTEVYQKEEVCAVAWSNKGDLLATASMNDDIKLLNVQTEQIESTFPSEVNSEFRSSDYFFSMAFNSDDSKLACHFRDQVQVWETSSKTLQIRISVEPSLTFLPVVCFQGPRLITTSEFGVEVYCEERASGR